MGARLILRQTLTVPYTLTVTYTPTETPSGAGPGTPGAGLRQRLCAEGPALKVLRQD